MRAIPTSASGAELRAHPWAHHHRSPWAAIACMGVVFGDIGTSPLYTLNVAAKAASQGGYGFMEIPNVPQGLATAAAQGKLSLPNPDTMTYFTGHETIVPLGHSPGMARWREALFAFMHRNAQRPAAYFRIPWPQVMEIGVEFEI